MDGPWHRNREPTVKGKVLVAADDEHDQRALATATRAIEHSPQNSSCWLARSGLLRGWGFPELAAGDAHKALLLKETNAAFRKLCEALLDAHAYTDAHEVYRRWIVKYPGDTKGENAKKCHQLIEEGVARMKHMTEGLPDADQKALQNIGHVLVRDYPWMTPEQTHRSDSTKHQVASEVKTISKGCAELAVSNIRGTDTDVWGIIASKKISAGQLIMADPALFAVADKEASLEQGITQRCTTCALPLRPRGNIKGTCKTCTYCSTACRTKAESTFHHKLCPADLTFPFLHPGVPPRPIVRLHLYARFLSTLIAEASHDNTIDPLTLPTIARITPNVGGPETHAFNYHDHIVYPNQILQDHGIDIFTDARWDTWVLLTIRRRIDNNNHGQIIHGVYPDMAMFNHSCAPNVILNEGADGGDAEGRAVLHLRAGRDVEVGEELFIRYAGEEDDGVEERRYKLLHWLGRDCGCVRCVGEEMVREMGGLGVRG